MSGERHGLGVRAAVAADAPFLQPLMAQAGRAAPALGEELDRLRADGGLALLAEGHGPPEGLMVLHWLRTPGQDPLALSTLLFVAREARRRGVARLLLKTGAQAARAAGCARLLLLQPPGAERLEAFCEASGFVADARGWSRSLRKGHPR